MARPLMIQMPPEPEQPEEAIKRVLELIKRLRDRTLVMRALEEADARDRYSFNERIKVDWDALTGLAESLRVVPPEERDMDTVDRLIDQRDALVERRRKVHAILVDMVAGIAADAAAATGHSEQWMLGALSYVVKPQERELQHLINVNFELEAIADDLDPSSGSAGDIIQSPEEVIDWMQRAIRQ